MGHEEHEVDVSRRDLGAVLAALGGAVGLAAITGCESHAGGGPEATSHVASALTGASFLWADTMTDLRGMTGTDTGATSQPVAVLGGYSSQGDGGGGVFYWDKSASTGDDGGTIIVPTGSTTGRWKRIYSGAVDVRWFGAKVDGTHDDSGALQSAINALYTNGRSGGTVTIPGQLALGGGSWTGLSFSSTFNDLTLLGTSTNAGFLIKSQPSQTAPIPNSALAFPWALLFTGCQRVTIRGLYFDAGTLPSGSGSGFVCFVQCQYCIVEGNHFSNTGTPSGVGQAMGVGAFGGSYNTVRGNRFVKCFNAMALGTGLNSPYDMRETDVLVVENALLDSLGDSLSFCAVRGTVAGNLIDRPTVGVAFSGIQMGGLQVTDQDLTISGNYIARHGFGIQWDTGGNSIGHLDYISIVGNTIQDCGVAAISATGCTGLTVSGNLLANDTSGIVCGGGDSPLIQDISIVGNSIFNTTLLQGYGIWLGAGKNVIVANNTIERFGNAVGYGGIIMDGVFDSVTIASNNVRDCSNYGLLIQGYTTTNLHVTDNTILLNSGDVAIQGVNGMRIDASTTALSTMTISGNHVCARNWTSSTSSVVAIWVNVNGAGTPGLVSNVTVSSNDILLDGAFATSSSATMIGIWGPTNGTANLSITSNTIQLVNAPSAVCYGIDLAVNSSTSMVVDMASNVFRGFPNASGYPIYVSNPSNTLTYSVISNVCDGGQLYFGPDPAFTPPPHAPVSRSSSTQLAHSSLALLTAVTAPGTPATGFTLYVDSADGKLKAKGSGGTVTTIASP